MSQDLTISRDHYQEHTNNRLAFTRICKYPPAKPGALKLEPLEAADGVANAAPNLEPPGGGGLSAKG